MSSTVSFLMVVRINSLGDKVQSDRVIKSNPICNLRYFKYFFIIKYIDFE